MFGRLKGPLEMVSSCRAESIETRTAGGGGASDPATSEVLRIQLHSMSILPRIGMVASGHARPKGPPNFAVPESIALQSLKIPRPKPVVKHPSSRLLSNRPAVRRGVCPTVGLTCHPDAITGHLTCPRHPHRGGA